MRLLLSIISSISSRFLCIWQWGLSSFSIFTKTSVPLMPFFDPLVISISYPSTFNFDSSFLNAPPSMPQSISAPRTMSPLMPEKQSKYNVFIANPLFISFTAFIERFYIRYLSSGSFSPSLFIVEAR